MSLKNMDVTDVMRRLADRRIDEAMQEGKFDNLPGAGKPLNLDPMPADEGARLMWWTLRILRNNDVIPDEVKWRKQLDGLRGELAATMDEKRVASLVMQINATVHRINTLGTNALKAPVVPVELETELERLRNRQSSARG